MTAAAGIRTALRMPEYLCVPEVTGGSTRDSRLLAELAARATSRFDWRLQPVEAAGRTLPMAVAADPDRLLIEACRRQEAGNTDAPDPFWAQVWRATGGIDCFLDDRDLTGIKVLELGCGTGLAGIASLLRGADVTFTDGLSDPLLMLRITLLRLAEQLAGEERDSLSSLEARVRAAGYGHGVRRLRFGVDRIEGKRFDLILGSDISYLRSFWRQLDETLRQHLAPHGEVLLSDPYRSIAGEFRDWIAARGWCVEEHERAVGGKPIRILRLRQAV